MKVITKGREQKGWAKEFKCTGEGNSGGGCGAVLLVEQDDVFKTALCSMGEREFFNSFRCSECGVVTDLPANVHLPFTPKPQDPQKAQQSSFDDPL